jgi:predicted HTH domain antitoxin
MDLHIPEGALPADAPTAEEMLEELAIALYRSGRITAGHGCRMTNRSQIEFQRLLNSRGVEQRYSTGDLARDLATLDGA